jgi:hypothetical protein
MAQATAPILDSTESGQRADMSACPLRADCVAKVFLHRRPQIFRAVEAAFE